MTCGTDEFMRQFYAELPESNNSPRIAYNRTESWHNTEYGSKRFKNYETFKTIRCRFLKRHRREFAYQATKKKVEKIGELYALFEQVIETYISTPALREQYKQKWNIIAA